MAATKYFSDINGETVELWDVHGLDTAKFSAAFPGTVGRRYDSFRRFVGYRHGQPRKDENLLPVTRSINYKSNPSKHVCDARCMHAKGRTMNCECSCGGKNHGRGFVAEAGE